MNSTAARHIKEGDQILAYVSRPGDPMRHCTVLGTHRDGLYMLLAVEDHNEQPWQVQYLVDDRVWLTDNARETD